MGGSYYSIKSSTESLYKEKGSKFIGFAHPVESEDEVSNILKSYRKEYNDARHVCYAFILGKDGEHFRSSDDGEPSNSAGPPILGQIRSHELTNTLVVVVRYFGGTKLGVVGLVSAYKEAATACLSKAEKIEKHPEHLVTIYFEYPQMNTVMRLVKDFNLRITTQNFEMKCELKAYCRDSELETFSEKCSESQIKISLL